MASGDRIKLATGIDWGDYKVFSQSIIGMKSEELDKVIEIKGKGFIEFLDTKVIVTDDGYLEIAHIKVTKDEEVVIDVTYENEYHSNSYFDYTYDSSPIHEGYSGNNIPLKKNYFSNSMKRLTTSSNRIPLFFEESFKVEVATGDYYMDGGSSPTKNESKVRLHGGLLDD